MSRSRSSGTMTVERSSASVERPVRGGSASAHQHVPSPAEAVDDPVEVALALAVTLVVGKARVATVLVSNDRQVGQADRSSRRLALPLVPQHEAPPDVEVPVEAEPL